MYDRCSSANRGTLCCNRQYWILCLQELHHCIHSRHHVQVCRTCRHVQGRAACGVPAHLVFPELRLAATGQAKGVEEGTARVAVVHGLELAALAQPVVLGAGILEVHQPLGLHPASQHYLDEQQGRCAAGTQPISYMCISGGCSPFQYAGTCQYAGTVIQIYSWMIYAAAKICTTAIGQEAWWQLVAILRPCTFE